MEFIGKITSIGETRTGTSQKGEWANVEFEVTEDVNQYPNIALFSMFKNGEHVKYAKDFNNYYKVGDLVKVEFNMGRRDYQKKDGTAGVFYQNSVWKLTKMSGSEVQQENDESLDVLPW